MIVQLLLITLMACPLFGMDRSEECGFEATSSAEVEQSTFYIPCLSPRRDISDEIVQFTDPKSSDQKNLILPLMPETAIPYHAIPELRIQLLNDVICGKEGVVSILMNLLEHDPVTVKTSHQLDELISLIMGKLDHSKNSGMVSPNLLQKLSYIFSRVVELAHRHVQNGTLTVIPEDTKKQYLEIIKKRRSLLKKTSDISDHSIDCISEALKRLPSSESRGQAVAKNFGKMIGGVSNLLVNGNPGALSKALCDIIKDTSIQRDWYDVVYAIQRSAHGASIDFRQFMKLFKTIERYKQKNDVDWHIVFEAANTYGYIAHISSNKDVKEHALEELQELAEYNFNKKQFSKESTRKRKNKLLKQHVQRRVQVIQSNRRKSSERSRGSNSDSDSAGSQSGSDSDDGSISNNGSGDDIVGPQSDSEEASDQDESDLDTDADDSDDQPNGDGNLGDDSSNNGNGNNNGTGNGPVQHITYNTTNYGDTTTHEGDHINKSKKTQLGYVGGFGLKPSYKDESQTTTQNSTNQTTTHAADQAAENGTHRPGSMIAITTVATPSTSQQGAVDQDDQAAKKNQADTADEDEIIAASSSAKKAPSSCMSKLVASKSRGAGRMSDGKQEIGHGDERENQSLEEQSVEGGVDEVGAQKAILKIITQEDLKNEQKVQRINTVLDQQEEADRKQLLNHHYDHDGKMILHIALDNGGGLLIPFLISKGALVTEKDENGDTVAHQAIMHNQLPELKLIVLANKNILKEKNDDNETPAAFAKSYGKADLGGLLARVRRMKNNDAIEQEFNALMNSGTDDQSLISINIATQFGNLIKAAQEGNLKDVNSVLEELPEEADVDWGKPYGKKKRTLLHWAAMHNWNPIVMFLTAIKKVPVNPEDYNGLTPAAIAHWKKHKGIVDILLRHGGTFTINHQADNTITAQLLADASKGNLENVKTAIRFGAHINASDANGNTPLLNAAKANKANVVKCLIEHGAYIEEKKDFLTPFLWSVYHNNCELAKYLLGKGGDIKAVDAGKNTALHMAAYRENLSMIKFLLNNGLKAAIHFKNQSGQTPYSCASNNIMSHTRLRSRKNYTKHDKQVLCALKQG